MSDLGRFASHVRCLMARSRHTNTDRSPRDVAALADRARTLLAEHSLPEALARLVTEVTGTPQAYGDELINWRTAGIPRRTWHRLISSGELPGSLVGREYLARRADVQAYVQSCRVTPRVPSSNGMSSDLVNLLASGKMVRNA